MKLKLDQLRDVTGGIGRTEFDYIVEPGDTLDKLTARFGGTPAQLRALNGLGPGEEPKAGRILRIPKPE